MSYTSQEKLQICLDIANKLKNYTNANGVCVNLFNDTYTFIPKLKAIFSGYINGNVDYKGTLQFEEIDKTIKYYFPVSKKQKATFVIKM
jgi:hypothetical protein